MVGAPSFSQPYLCIQPTLQSQPRNSFSTSANFHLPIPPLLFHKIILTIPTNTPCLYTSAIFHLPLFAYNHPNNLNQNFLLTLAIWSIQVLSRDQRARELCQDWHCFNLYLFFLKVWAMIAGLTISDSFSLRFRKLVYCRCGKLSNPPSLITSTYCHYLHILLIPRQELILPWKLVA